MTEVVVLKCPQCGGAIEAGERRCHHCRAELLTIRCPGCFRLHHAGSSLCTQCGVPLGLEAQLGPLGIPCPRCQGGELVGIALEGNDLGECQRCGGLFVEHAILERATRAAEGRRGLRMRPSEAKQVTADASMYLRCPRCQQYMNRHNFGRVSGVIVDICGEHGTWFDKDELSQIIEFVEAHGLERAISGGPKRQFPNAGGRLKTSELPEYSQAGAFARALTGDLVGGLFDAITGRRRF